MKKNTFRKTNLNYIVDYDYDRTCCTCRESICRCTEIVNTRITQVNVNDVIEKLYSKHSQDNSAIDAYCFDRICHALEIYNEDLYEVEVGGGYYGEEVYGVWFENEEKVFDAYQNLLALNADIDKIKYCLQLEYDYLINCVYDAFSATVVEVSTKEIYVPQMEYFRKVDKNVIEAYRNSKLPIAVCVRDGDRYRLVDGYHRFVANKDREKVDIVVLE